MSTQSFCKVGALALFAATVIMAQDAVIEVDAAQRASYRIPRTIYGSFLEPIGNSTYGGLVAQVLENPSFEENLWSLSALKRKALDNPGLYRASDLGLPVPWEPLDSRQGARYEPRWNDAANSYRSLLIMALPNAQTGVRQQVYLPVHRVLGYAGSLYVKHVSGPAAVEVSLRKRNHPEQVLAKAAIALKGTDWARYEFKLDLKQGALERLEPADFVIAMQDGTRALVDQAFLFPTDHVDGMDPEMIRLSRDMKTPVVRFGGNFTSAYHWRDGIGPMDKRVSMLNLSWGMPEYNHFGTDEFLSYCRHIGAAPQIALNLGTGTPQEAAEWVAYVNKHWNEGEGGLLWELGNELWGDFQTGYPTQERIAALTKSYSDAVKRVDPSARLIATGADPDHFDEWNAEELKNPPGTFQFLSTHFVVGDDKVLRKNPSREFVALSTFALPVELERKLRAMHKQIESNPNGRAGGVKIAFTEWLFYGNDDRVPSFHNMGGAIAAAGMLNTLMRVADFTAVSDMTGIIEFGGIWKKRSQVYGVPAYWAFRMFSNADATVPVASQTKVESYDVQEGNERLPTIEKVPYLDVVAALNDAGDRLVLFCVNRHLDRDLRARIDVKGFNALPEAQAQTLSSTSIYAFNDEVNPEEVHPVATTAKVEKSEWDYTFRRSSVTVLELKKAK